MKWRPHIYFSAFLTTLLLTTLQALGQPQYEKIIQINGVIITADSLRAVAGATVLVKHQDRGVYSGNAGVFSIVCYKGDTLQFRCRGFRPKEYVVSPNIQGQYFSLIQLMVQDTFYLPGSILRPLPDKSQLDYAFSHSYVPDDRYEIARKNTNALMLRALAMTLPRDGREAQALYQNQQWHDAVYYGQQKPMNILNPLAWAEFYESWKRGDYRKQNLPIDYSNY